MRFRLLVVVLTLLTPALAAAQAQTLGSPLTAEPNVSIDCSARPTIVNVNGDYGPVASGTPDCTWRQAGVFAPAPGDTRFSSVPGDGRITSVTVKSGPAPVAALRFVVMRQLFAPGDGTSMQCCFYVGETDPVQPAPNTTQTFPVNLPVQRNVIDGLGVVDLIGVSAASGTGNLPIAIVGPVNTFALTQPGNSNAGNFYPRMGSIPNDAGGGRREDGVPGLEVLIQWTWCPASAGGSTPGVCPTGGVGGGGGGGGGGGAAGPALRDQTPQVANGKALIDLICNGDTACKGRLELLSALPADATARAAAAPAAKGAKVIRYGKKKYAMDPGGSADIQVKLTGKAKKLLKQNGSLSVGLQLTPKSGAGLSTTVTLTP